MCQNLSRLLVRIGVSSGSSFLGSRQNLFVGQRTFNSCIFCNSCGRRLSDLRFCYLCYFMSTAVDVTQLFNLNLAFGELNTSQLSEDLLRLVAGGVEPVQILIRNLFAANQLTHDLGTSLSRLQVHALLSEQSRSGVENLCFRVLRLCDLCLCLHLLNLGSRGGRYCGFGSLLCFVFGRLNSTRIRSTDTAHDATKHRADQSLVGAIVCYLSPVNFFVRVGSALKQRIHHARDELFKTFARGTDANTGQTVHHLLARGSLDSILHGANYALRNVVQSALTERFGRDVTNRCDTLGQCLDDACSQTIRQLLLIRRAVLPSLLGARAEATQEHGRHRADAGHGSRRNVTE
ncbi:MAG: hypothetical protein IKU90_05790 [Clostridia bacterium]|nr:hypothetical protein [Clostridia bacterium]